MPENYPKVVYHKDGRHTIVDGPKDAIALGEGWGDVPNENTHQAIRKASGGIAETIVPVRGVREESV